MSLLSENMEQWYPRALVAQRHVVYGTHDIITFNMLSASLASFAKVFGRFWQARAKLIWLSTDALPALTLSFGTYQLLFPKLTNKLFPIHSFLVKVLRKPIPSIHHIKIRHYISPLIFLGLPTSRNTFYIIGKLHESLKAVSVNI